MHHRDAETQRDTEKTFIMKQLIISITILISISACVFAQNPDQPSANGSLFTQASATALVTDFKPRGVGDLVFVDVVEASNANVSSAANRSRDSGTIGGL